jgi:hypothetical protein
VKASAIRLGVLALVGTVALAAALSGAPHDRALALAAYLAFVCALALTWLARGDTAPLPRDDRVLGRARAPRAEKPPLPEQLDWLARRLATAQGTGRELHVYFRPLVRQIASAALAGRHGIALDGQPERARAVVGERVWELVRADRPEPDRETPGLSPAELRALIDDLEAISQ